MLADTLNVILLLAGCIVLIWVIVLLIRRRRIVRLTEDEFAILEGKHFDKYELKSFLVRGDFNTTYKGFDRDSNKHVAVRVLDRQYIFTDIISQQFAIKGEVLKFLCERFPGESFLNNVRCGTAGVRGEERPYIITDYVPGASLAEILRYHNRLSYSDVLKIARQVGESLSKAHTQRIWIRELNPRNILLSVNSKGNLVTTIANVGTPFEHLTTSHADIVKGYYSPEDRNGREVDQRSDVYALAGLMFRLLEGYEPSRREPTRKAVPLLDAPLSENPSRRPQSIELFLNSLPEARNERDGLPWSSTISRCMRRRSTLIVKKARTNEVREKDRGIIGIPPITSATKRQLGWAFLTGSITAFVLWIGRKIETLLASPKKTIMLVGAAVASTVVALWYFLVIPEEGLLKVLIREDSRASLPIYGAVVSFEAFDTTTNAPVQMTLEGGDKSSETGTLVTRSDKAGLVVLKYEGNFERESVVMKMAVESDNHATVVREVGISQDEETVPLRLRPVRKGLIQSRIGDPHRLLDSPGLRPPESYYYEITAEKPNGEPLKFADFTINGKKIPAPSIGKTSSPAIDFKNGRTDTIRFKAEEGGVLTISAVFGEGYSSLKMKTIPEKVQVEERTDAFQMKVELQRQTVGGPVEFVITVLGDGDIPWDGVDVFLDNKNSPIGTTDGEGQVRLTVQDVNFFYEATHSIVLNLRTYDSRLPRWSTPFLLGPSQGRDIKILISDVIPE